MCINSLKMPKLVKKRLLFQFFRAKVGNFTANHVFLTAECQTERNDTNFTFLRPSVLKITLTLALTLGQNTQNGHSTKRFHLPIGFFHVCVCVPSCLFDSVANSMKNQFRHSKRGVFPFFQSTKTLFVTLIYVSTLGNAHRSVGIIR